jgi:hypothetical protein
MEGDRISCKTFRALEELTKGSDGAVQSTEQIFTWSSLSQLSSS